ncbi:Flp family type IVb pilin [Chelatococcus sp. GCM10030263]
MGKAFLRDKKGSTTIEYGVIAVFVILGIIANLTIIGPAVARLIGSTHLP